MSNKVKSLSCPIALVLAGCVSAPPPSLLDNKPVPKPDMANAEFGSYPNNYKEIIYQWASMNLKDAESARYQRISKPRKEYMVEKREPFYGYSTCVLINAKNSYGAYTGNNAYWFMIRDGKIVRSQRIDAGFPGKRISLGHNVNCEDGE